MLEIKGIESLSEKELRALCWQLAEENARLERESKAVGMALEIIAAAARELDRQYCPARMA